MNPTPTNPNSLLKEIAKIQQMERGKISVIRETSEGCFYNHQTWENGKNVSRYVPCDQVTALQQAINGYQQFKQLTEEYAQHIIDQKKAKFDASKFDDRYEDALLELIRAKKAGKKAPKAKAPAKPSNVVNLFDALKKSLNAQGGGKAGKSSSKASAARTKAKASAPGHNQHRSRKSA